MTILETTPNTAALEERISRAADAANAYEAGTLDEIELRDRAIVQAIDAGIGRIVVARWARLSPPRITQIVARRCAEAQG